MNFQVLLVAGVLLVRQERWDPRKPKPIVVEVLRNVDIVKGLSLKKGDRFETVADLGEGSCRIRYQKKTYVVAECPWMGFRDMKEDTFKIISRVTR
jgi:hypothetical protein